MGSGAGDAEGRQRPTCTADRVEGGAADGGGRPGTSDGSDALDNRAPKKTSVARA